MVIFGGSMDIARKRRMSHTRGNLEGYHEIFHMVQGMSHIWRHDKSSNRLLAWFTKKRGGTPFISQWHFLSKDKIKYHDSREHCKLESDKWWQESIQTLLYAIFSLQWGEVSFEEAFSGPWSMDLKLLHVFYFYYWLLERKVYLASTYWYFISR